MKCLVFLGSVRESTPPRPARVGSRVAAYCVQQMRAHFPAFDTVELVDVLDCDWGTVFKPYFAYAPSQAPESMRALAQKIAEADAYVMVSPEYNHSMSPALADTLNHFPSSSFSYKPSLIVTYSAGQWGGTRAAVQMRAFLSELGCLPVSAMVHVPRAAEALTQDGVVADNAKVAEWQSYVGRALAQLQWWAQACRTMRAEVDPLTVSQAFVRNPSQRNAP